MKHIFQLKLFVLSVCSLIVFCSSGFGQDLRAKFQEAIELSQSGDYEKAIEKLREIEEVDANSPVLAFHLGYNLHANGKLDEAIEYHKKSIDYGPTKVLGLYNLACAYSLKKDKDNAFKYLKQSIEAGYHDPDQVSHAKGDTDFANIKDDPRWKDMVAMMENGGKMPEEKDGNPLLGTWKMESGMKAGAKIEDSHLSEVVITKKTFTMPSSAGEPFVMSYKADMDAKPMTIDFKIDSGPMAVGSKSQGIFKVEDGMMSLCYDPKGESRPEKMDSTEENGFFVFKLKKSEKKDGGDKKSLAKQVTGKWKCVKGVRGGADIAEERMATVITIDDKNIRIPVSEDAAFVMSYTIDESKSPATIDMSIEEGPAPQGQKAIGIVKMEDGKFFLCYDSMGSSRPEKFEAEDEGHFYFELKRAED